MVKMAKIKEIGIICLIMLIFVSCRSAKHTVEHYEAHDSVIAQRLENRATTIEWLKADTMSIAIVIEQLDTVGRVTTRAVVTKQRKIDNYATKIDSISVSSDEMIVSKQSFNKEVTPGKASSSYFWILVKFGLLILVIILIFTWLRR